MYLSKSILIINQQNFYARESSQKWFVLIEEKTVCLITQSWQYKAFHSLNHHSGFQWPEDRSSQEQQRIKKRPDFENEYIRRLYNDRMQRKISAKYNASQDTFRVIPNQITAKRDQQVLSKEIQHFNHSKFMPNTNPEYQESLNQHSPSLQRNYQSAKEINNKPSIPFQYHLPHLNHSKNIIYDNSQQPNMRRSRLDKLAQNQKSREEYQKPPSPRYSKEIVKDYQQQIPDLYRRPYMRNAYGPQSLKNYQSYADLINDSSLQPPIHPLRNYMPDQLEGHLRQNLRQERRKPTIKSLSIQTRLKH